MILAENIFVDTSAWLALADSNDMHHQKAASSFPVILKNSQKLYTTNMVLSEAYTLLREELGHKAAMTFLISINTSPRIKVLYSDREIEKEAQELLPKFYDQPFSYTDAVSFIFMQKLKMKKAFSFDKHFLIAGYILTP